MKYLLNIFRNAQDKSVLIEFDDDNTKEISYEVGNPTEIIDFNLKKGGK
jgi:hypothetical protein